MDFCRKQLSQLMCVHVYLLQESLITHWSVWLQIPHTPRCSTAFTWLKTNKQSWELVFGKPSR